MKDREKPHRKPYSKPEVRRVELTPEESLATGCKYPTAGGPFTTCENGPCFADGS
jgi:hypothetical protein